MLLADYDHSNFFDEMFSGDGTVRPHYRAVTRGIEQLPVDEYRQKQGAVELAFMRGGITFTVYSDDQGTERIFPFDCVPRVIPAAEWNTIETGLMQRITALNLFLHDIYHEQKILKDRIVPAAYILGAKHFRREFMHFEVPRKIYVHVCGTDLIRDGDGRYLVLEDNLRCPSGASYMLENRAAIRRALPRPAAHVGRPSGRWLPPGAAERAPACGACGVRGEDQPNVVLLTPGVYNSAYFEHAFLARQMGMPIVEGRDLVVRDFRVHMRTTAGLVPVDVIYRRIDDDFLDPSVFRADSMLGVPGLVNAARAGNVALPIASEQASPTTRSSTASSHGSSSTTSARTRSSESVKTYLASEPADRSYILENLRKLVVKSANEAGGYGMLMGPWATEAEIDIFADQIRANPRNFIAQPPISLSRHPTWVGETGKFEGRHIDLRPYILFGEKVTVTPGGLTRVALRRGRWWSIPPRAAVQRIPGCSGLRMNLPRQRILSRAPSGAMLSRVAAGLYWMSRYLERAENIARLLDVNLQLLIDFGAIDDRRSRPLAADPQDRRR